jgi:hypothetical protein
LTANATGMVLPASASRDVVTTGACYAAKSALVNGGAAEKRTLIEEAGGRCQICGYAACAAALQFHHVDPSEKSFALSHEGVARNLQLARAEAAKCILLCANCHAEVEVGYRKLPAALTLSL